MSNAHVFCADAPTGVVDEALAEEVQTVGARRGEEVAEGRLRELPDGDVVWQLRVALRSGVVSADAGEHVQTSGETYWPVIFGRRAERTEDRLQLVHVGLAGQVGRAQHQLGKDAAHGPDVDGRAVVAATEEQLGRPVPSTRDRYSASV